MEHLSGFSQFWLSRQLWPEAIISRIFFRACCCLLIFWLPHNFFLFICNAAAGDALSPSKEMEAEKSPGRQGMDSKGRPLWISLEPGLDFCEIRLNESNSKLTALRIDPEKFDFVLCSSNMDFGAPRTLEQWAKEYGLTAAINASMFLPDNNKSTGYMRSGQYVNNPRIMDRFGAFFVAGPRKEGMPRAAIIDRDEKNWRQKLDDYDTVIQNYRMTSAGRKILWSPGGPLYSISAVAQDGEGRILFLHSRAPVEAYSFVQQLLHLPLDVRTVMYVEGGAQAGLLVHSTRLKRNLAGAHAPSLLVTGKLNAALPNILGIRPRHAFMD